MLGELKHAVMSCCYIKVNRRGLSINDSMSFFHRESIILTMCAHDWRRSKRENLPSNSPNSELETNAFEAIISSDLSCTKGYEYLMTSTCKFTEKAKV